MSISINDGIKIAALVASMERPSVPPLARHPVHDRTKYLFKGNALTCSEILLPEGGWDHAIAVFTEDLENPSPETAASSQHTGDLSEKKITTGWELQKCRYLIFVMPDSPAIPLNGIIADLCENRTARAITFHVVKGQL